MVEWCARRGFSRAKDHSMKSVSAYVVSLCLVLISAIARPASEWKELFNGKDLTGWTTNNPAWKVENGAIVGGQGNGRGSLLSNSRYKDFELELDFMLAEQPDAHDGSCGNCTYHRGGYPHH